MKFAALFSLLLLAACAPEELPNFAPISFTNEPPILLKVANVQIVDEYVPPKTLPNVEHAAPTPPYRAVRIWADDRLKATGATGYVRVGIKDAHIIQKQLVGQIEYDGRIDVEIDAESDNGAKTGNAEVAVERQVITDSDKDLADKVKIWDEMTRQMMADFDRGMSSAIAQKLSLFTARTGNMPQ